MPDLDQSSGWTGSWARMAAPLEVRLLAPMHATRRQRMAQHAPASAHKRASQVSTSQGKAPRLMIPIFKLPVVLYRLHLGWLLGTRFMQLTHIGRRSGRLHRTVLAVLRFDTSTKELYAVSAWPGSDWYANIQAAPAMLVECGVVRYVPR